MFMFMYMFIYIFILSYIIKEKDIFNITYFQVSLSLIICY